MLLLRRHKNYIIIVLTALAAYFFGAFFISVIFAWEEAPVNPPAGQKPKPIYANSTQTQAIFGSEAKLRINNTGTAGDESDNSELQLNSFISNLDYDVYGYANTTITGYAIDSFSNGYIVAGKAIVDSINPGTALPFIASFDARGNKAWSKVIYTDYDSYFNSVIASTDNKFYAVGSYKWYDSGAGKWQYDPLFCKFDNSGDKEWCKRINLHRPDVPGYGQHEHGEAYAVLEDNDGNILLGGGYWITGIGIDPGNYGDAILNKYNPDGAVIWAKTIDHFMNTYPDIENGYEKITSIIQDAYDNTYVVAGKLDESLTTSGAEHQVFVTKVNVDGTHAGSRRAKTILVMFYWNGYKVTIVQDPASYNYIFSYVLYDRFSDNQFFVVEKHNRQNMNSIWQSSWIIPDASRNMENYGAIIDSDGEIMALGKRNFGSAGGDDAFLFRARNSDGSIIWAKRIGGDGSDYGYGLTSVSDGAVIAGSTNSHGLGSENLLLLQINNDGEICDSCDYINDTSGTFNQSGETIFEHFEGSWTNPIKTSVTNNHIDFGDSQIIINLDIDNIYQGCLSDIDAQWSIYSEKTSGKLSISHIDAGVKTDYFTINKDTGNVGLNTDSAAEKLTVEGGDIFSEYGLPEFAGLISTSYTPIDMDIAGKYAYVVSESGGTGRLTIFDISDPENISQLGYNETMLTYPTSVQVLGNYAYVTDRGQGLSIFDVSDPNNIIAKDIYPDPDNSGNDYQPNDVYVAGQYAYMASRYTADEGIGRFSILDISDKDSIKLIHYFNSEHVGAKNTLANPSSVFIKENLAYIVNAYNTYNQGSFVIYDIASQEQPCQPTDYEFFSATIPPPLLKPKSVFVSGDYAYIANTYNAISPATASILIYDVSEPGSTSLISEFTPSACGNPQDVFVSGDYLYIACGAGDNITIYNVEYPVMPILAGQVADSLDNVARVFVSGSYLYAINAVANTLTSYKLTGLESLAGIAADSASLGGLDVEGSGIFSGATSDLAAGSLNIGGSATLNNALNINSSAYFNGNIIIGNPAGYSGERVYVNGSLGNIESTSPNCFRGYSPIYHWTLDEAGEEPSVQFYNYEYAFDSCYVTPSAPLSVGNGSVSPSRVPGKHGYARDFSQAYLYVGDDLPFPSPGAVMAWVKADSAPLGDNIETIMGVEGEWVMTWDHTDHDTHRIAIWIHVLGEEKRCTENGSLCFSNSGECTCEATGVMNPWYHIGANAIADPTGWHHLAATRWSWSGTALYCFYIDGDYFSGDANTSCFDTYSFYVDTGLKFTVGGMQLGSLYTKNTFRGVIDDVRIYQNPAGTQAQPLSQADINTIYNCSTPALKNFKIDHPLKPGCSLIHSSIEGPENAVFYRGAARLENGRTIVSLPEYFEALTRLEGRTIYLTAIGSEPYQLSYGEIENGQFSVYGEKQDGEFSWEVKAVRDDVPELEVEQLRIRK